MDHLLNANKIKETSIVQNSTAHGWELHKIRFVLFAGLRKLRKQEKCRLLWCPLFHIVFIYFFIF